MYTDIIPISEAKKTLLTIVREAHELGRTFAITNRGRPTAVIMGINEYESILETLEILADKNAMEAIRKGREDIKAGRWTSLEDLEHELQSEIV